MAGGQSAANDDGEPGGTAGRPMLEVLRHHELEGVLATVVRYFGGVKLGAGGLVRAYTDSVAQALAGATWCRWSAGAGLHAPCPMRSKACCAAELAAAGATLDEVSHHSMACFRFSLPEPAIADFIARIDDAVQGRAVWPRA